MPRIQSLFIKRGIAKAAIFRRNFRIEVVQFVLTECYQLDRFVAKLTIDHLIFLFLVLVLVLVLVIQFRIGKVLAAGFANFVVVFTARRRSHPYFSRRRRWPDAITRLVLFAHVRRQMTPS